MCRELLLELDSDRGPVTARLVRQGMRQSESSLGSVWRDEKPLLELYADEGRDPWGRFIDYLVLDLAPLCGEIHVVPAWRLSAGSWRLGQLTADGRILAPVEVERLSDWILSSLFSVRGYQRSRRSALA